MASAVALIPARAGSTRVPGKNVRELAGHPLIAYTIATARESELFGSVLVSTDSQAIADVALRYGAEAPWLRPESMAGSTSPDIDWVRHALDAAGRSLELFAILRPTSPFRSADSIRSAHEALLAEPDADSIRAVALCREHPGKMWTIGDPLMQPLLEQPDDGVPVPLHSRQYAALPEVYVQDSSLEIARVRAVYEHGSISGERVLPFLSRGAEGFSIDYPDDWERAEALIASGEARLPEVTS
ncbi:MAG: acylneuraminate cytidylyltransferase family protein [Thermoleophilaceae bacterium]|nr:acylneuraminate cytidylyltransferase family protein [Thermoleophilaceae bacterium]